MAERKPFYMYLSTSQLLTSWYHPFLPFLNSDASRNAMAQTYLEFLVEFRNSGANVYHNYAFLLTYMYSPL